MPHATMPLEHGARVVLDTNVVASAMLWGGSPLKLLHAARTQRLQLYTSLPLLAELTDILGRTKFDRKVAASGFTIDQIVDRYAAMARTVRPASIAPTILADPDDDVVLATAKAARARLIVSGDRHLLSLSAGFEGILIVSVAAAIASISQPG